MLEVDEHKGIRVHRSGRLLSESGIALMFSGRKGGVSSGPWESLNLSYNVGDTAASVTENRGRVGELLGVDPRSWTLCRQVHGATVMEVGQLERGRGGLDHMSGIPRTDSLVTSIPGIAIGVLTADCVPLILAAQGSRCVAAVHSGWRGTMAGVASRALEKLLRLSGCQPDDVMAFIGPHIGGCCMVVGETVAGDFDRVFGGAVSSHGPGATTRIDLGRACSIQLERAGVTRERIFEVGECTFCGAGYFSHRRSAGLTGRQAALVAVLPG